MATKFARASLHEVGPYRVVVTLHVNDGDYHELVAIDKYHGRVKAEAFCCDNNIILTKFEGVTRTGAQPVEKSMERVASFHSESRPLFFHQASYLNKSSISKSAPMPTGTHG